MAHELLLIYLHYIVWQNKKNHFYDCVLHLAHKLMDRSKQPITPIYIFTCYHHYWVLPSSGFVVHLWMNEQWMVDLMSWRVEQLLIRTKNPHQSNIIVRQFWFCQLGRWCNVICSDKGLTCKMSALKLFTVADTAPVSLETYPLYEHNRAIQLPFVPIMMEVRKNNEWQIIGWKIQFLWMLCKLQIMHRKLLNYSHACA